jgi:hypothetical protein
MNGQLNPLSSQHADTTGQVETTCICLPGQIQTQQTLETSGRLIPFLLESQEQNWITRDLCRLLGRRNHDTILCHIDESAPPAKARVVDENTGQQAGHHEYCLLPVTSPQSILKHQFSHVVFLVSANLDAVCLAYQRIKLLADAPPEIGIVMVGPRDQHAAWRFFRKLAVGTLRYLDIPLLNLGFLPDQITPPYGAADHHRDNFLTRISERLLRSEFHVDEARTDRKSE